MTDYDLFPALDGPASAAADNPVVLGIQWSLAGVAPAWLLGYRFWRATTAVTGPITARTYRVVNAAVGAPIEDTDATFVLSGTGWQTALLDTPPPLVLGTAYRAALHFPSGYAATGAYFTTGPGVGGLTNGPLRAPDVNGAAGGDQGSFHYGAELAYPDGSFNGGNYWVSPLITDVDPAEVDGPPDVDAVFAVGRLRLGWASGPLRLGWTPGRVRTGWTPGRIV